MSNRRIPYLVPGLPPGAEEEDVRRLFRLVGDLSRYASGSPPRSAELAAAPLLDRWTTVVDPTAVRLAGLVSGHPRIDGPTAVSSRIYALDPDMRWARSYSRLWRLGSREQG